MTAFDFLRIARGIGRKAMRIAARGGGTETVATNPLGQKTIRADRELEELVVDELKKATVPCVLVTEEAGFVEISKTPKWCFVLDPLDGSENFKRGIPLF